MAESDLAASILSEGRQAHVAIDTPSGPHVTPQLYAWSGGRLWIAAASTTRKAAVLHEGAPAAAVVATPGRSVVLAGKVTVIDPHKPATVIRNLAQLPGAARASIGFTARNVVDLAAFAGDLLRGRLGWLVPPRILYALTPDRAAAVENDTVTWSAGWRAGRPSGGDGVVPTGGQPAVVALPGPVTAPARWFAEDRLAVVAPEVASLLGIADHRGSMAVVVDRYSAAGPAAKRGAMLRGGAEPLGAGRFRLSPDRVSEWDGIEVTSRKLH